jgi:hypothetical protein
VLIIWIYFYRTAKRKHWSLCMWSYRLVYATLKLILNFKKHTPFV